MASDKQFTGFLEGLGPAQLAGRQTLATPPMGNDKAELHLDFLEYTANHMTVICDIATHKLLWLAVCCSGDIQIGMVYRKERLDVEVIRARGLVGKQGNKNTPGTNTQ